MKFTKHLEEHELQGRLTSEEYAVLKNMTLLPEQEFALCKFLRNTSAAAWSEGYDEGAIDAVDEAHC